MNKKIRNALISVYNKERLEEVAVSLHQSGVRLYSTGGTRTFIEQLQVPVTAVEDLTGYPSILGGRVKTLHPKIFGGILNRSSMESDQRELEQFDIPRFDLVIVDLYPFEQTVQSGATHEEIIEKIDIGGVSLLRAAAKNYHEVVVIASAAGYPTLLDLLRNRNSVSTLEERKALASSAFAVTAHYDAAILNYFNQTLTLQFSPCHPLRYGENPHQKGAFYGNLETVFEKLSGKDLSYNNLLDAHAALELIRDFEDLKEKQKLITCAVIKHNNACGAAVRSDSNEAWDAALSGDPVSAFGGIIILNDLVTEHVALNINSIFFEMLLAPGYEPEALKILTEKKNRILLKTKPYQLTRFEYRTVLNGMLEQEANHLAESETDLKTVTQKQPSPNEVHDLLFANRIVKHTKSNAIVLARNRQLLASGTGQTSRVDALKQAIAKAKHFGFDLRGAVMASDAFFPFPDCVEIAGSEGITAIIQPGGSVKDDASIKACDLLNIAMVMTGNRHFRH